MDETLVQGEFELHFDRLKTSANRASNWRERLEAVEALGQWKNQQTIDVLKHRVNHDPVHKVQVAAFQKLREFGEEIELPPVNEGRLIKGITKTLIRIKKSLPKDHTYEDFKEKLKKMRLDIYDTYEGEKGEEFDQWLEKTWASLSIR